MERPARLPPASAEERLSEYRRTGERRLRNQVVEDHRWLAIVIAKEYFSGNEPMEDLVQVAFVALLKAAERFDPTFGVEFRTFAAVTARGELRRHYRDATWGVRVPRRLQELRYEIRGAQDVLQDRLRRSPTTQELAEYLHVEVDEILDALWADRNFRSLTLDQASGSDSIARDHSGGAEASFAAVDATDAFIGLLGMLPVRLRRVVEMRFVDQMKQADIASRIGVSQVQVSRLLRDAVNRLRVLLEHRDGPTARPWHRDEPCNGRARSRAGQTGRARIEPVKLSR